MSYLIKGASELDGVKKEFLIRERKIAYIAKKMEREKAIELNCGGFYIVPGRVAVNHSLALTHDFEERKQIFMDLQRKGLTTVLIICPVKNEDDLKPSLKRFRHIMINSSIDYVFGVSLPMRKLTPSFIRLCRREKVPFLFAQVEEERDFKKVTWEWIRDALYSYRFPIVPDWSHLEMTTKCKNRLQQQWLKIASKADIPTLSAFPEQDDVLGREAIRKIGISPYKGELRAGCDLDYSLYKSTSLADRMQFLYDKDSEPDVVVLKGQVMKAGETVYYRPGYGREITVRVPGYLASYGS